MTDHDLTLKDVQEGVAKALKNWSKLEGSTLEGLLDFLLIVRAAEAEAGENGRPYQARYATNLVLEDALEELAQQDEELATVLRMRYQDREKAVKVADRLHIGEATVYRRQNKGIEEVAKIIYSREMDFRDGRARALEAHLPPRSYTRLYGVDEAQAAVVSQLVTPADPWVVTLTGIGGIGKTALADAVTRQVIRCFRFERPIWLRSEVLATETAGDSPQTTFESIIAGLTEVLVPEARSFTHEKQRELVWRELKANPYLIVVDNLETEADTTFLLRAVRDLAEPSKFLLTTRTQPDGRAGVYRYSLSELSFQDASSLFVGHAREIGLENAAAAPPETVRSIYTVTGGNPLALKLVVSLLDDLPLPQILRDLQKGRASSVEAMYTRIYAQAWELLSEEAKVLLQVMPLVAGTGGPPNHIQEVAELPDDAFWSAIRELHRRSLLEVRGTLEAKRYGIHRLTETFVLTEIVNWPQGGAGGSV